MVLIVFPFVVVVVVVVALPSLTILWSYDYGWGQSEGLGLGAWIRVRGLGWVSPFRCSQVQYPIVPIILAYSFYCSRLLFLTGSDIFPLKFKNDWDVVNINQSKMATNGDVIKIYSSRLMNFPCLKKVAQMPFFTLPLFLGDYNSIMSENSRKDFCELYDLQNLIKGPNYYKNPLLMSY